MKLTIDNLDGAGVRDYTGALDAEHAARVKRALNRPAEMQAWLVADGAQFVAPVSGGRVVLSRNDGTVVFTGYLSAAPEYQYLGWSEHGPVYRYGLRAVDDSHLLDQKAVPQRVPFVARPAGEALRQLTADLLPGRFDTTGVAGLDVITSYTADPAEPWSYHAAELALRARAAYRVCGGALTFEPLGKRGWTLDEADEGFSPDMLQLVSPQGVINDVIAIGRSEPRAFVKSYFLGDGLTLHFGLPVQPFTRFAATLLEEEYKDATLSPLRWTVSDPGKKTAVNAGELRVTGGTGRDGETVVSFVEKLELGGALVLQHGEVSFDLVSDGVLGGLYAVAVSAAGCLAGFRVTKAGGQSAITALVNGATTGASVSTTPGHRYALTTRTYSPEVYRQRTVFHSSAHPAGNGVGGSAIAADVRVVLEVHDIDPANPGSLVAPSTVLYDNVIANAAGFATYALVNAIDLPLRTGLHADVAGSEHVCAQRASGTGVSHAPGRDDGGRRGVPRLLVTGAGVLLAVPAATERDHRGELSGQRARHGAGNGYSQHRGPGEDGR